MVQGNTEQALIWAEQRLNQNQEDAQAHRLLVQVHAQREDPNRVHESTTAGLLVDPDDPYLLYFHGRSLKMIGQHLDSIPFFERARQAGSNANDIALQIADAYDQAGLLDHAAQAYISASSADPNNRAARAQGGRILASLGRCDEARRMLAPLIPHLEFLPDEIQEAIATCTR